MPLRLRLAVLFAIGAAAVIALSSLLLVVELHKGLISSVDSGLRSRGDTVAQSVDDAGRLDSPDLAGARMVAPAEAPAQVIGPTGTVLDSSPGIGSGRLVDDRTLALARRHPVTLTVSRPERTRLLAAPVHVGSNTYVVVVGTRLETVDNAVDRVTVGLAIAGGPLVLLAGVAAWVVAGAALAPVERMRRQVAGMSEEDLRGNMAVPRTRDELAHLAATMNDLLGRVRDARERERRFVAEAGHELRTPLAILRGELELANRPGRSREELTEAVTVAGEETDRLVRLAEDLLFLARGDAAGLDLRYEEVALGDVVGRAVEASSGRAAQRGVSIDIDVAADSVAWMDADRLRQSIDNLLDNALQFSPAGGHIAVRAGVSDGRMRLEVVDDGPGFPVDFLAHAFERFARADESRAQGRGSGLGLAIVASIASAHGGTVSAGNRQQGGAWVRLDLPAGAPPSM